MEENLRRARQYSKNKMPQTHALFDPVSPAAGLRHQCHGFLRPGAIVARSNKRELRCDFSCSGGRDRLLRNAAWSRGLLALRWLGRIEIQSKGLCLLDKSRMSLLTVPRFRGAGPSESFQNRRSQIPLDPFARRRTLPPLGYTKHKHSTCSNHR